MIKVIVCDHNDITYWYFVDDRPVAYLEPYMGMSDNWDLYDKTGLVGERRTDLAEIDQELVAKFGQIEETIEFKDESRIPLFGFWGQQTRAWNKTLSERIGTHDQRI